MIRGISIKLIVIISTISLLLVSCGDSDPSSAQKKKSKPRPHLVEAFKVQLVQQGVSRERTGTLHAQKEVKVVNQEAGRIVKLPYFEGDKVKKDSLLVQIDDALLKAELAKAEASRIKAESDLKRIQGLKTQNFSSEEDLAQASTQLALAKADEALLRTRMGFTKIKAPFNGVITERLLEQGNVAERYSHIVTIADLSSLNTEVPVSELLLSKLKINDKVTLRIDALNHRKLGGRISRIHPSINPQTRRGIVEIEIKPVPKDLKPGQFVRVMFNTDVGDYLLIPFKAVRITENSSFVYIVDSENKAQPVAIKTGLRIDRYIEVQEGLSVNDKVVTKGFLNLKSGKAVKVVGEKAYEE